MNYTNLLSYLQLGLILLFALVCVSCEPYIHYLTGSVKIWNFDNEVYEVKIDGYQKTVYEFSNTSHEISWTFNDSNMDTIAYDYVIIVNGKSYSGMMLQDESKWYDIRNGELIFDKTL
jgi:hypothetical protein